MEESRANDPIQFAQVGISMDGREVYWAKLAGLAKHLQALPMDARLKIGYVPDRQRRPKLEQSNVGTGEKIVLLVSVGFYGSTLRKEFYTVQQMLNYLDKMPKVAGYLEYSKKGV